MTDDEYGGRTVVDVNGEPIARIAEVYVDEQSRRPSWGRVDVGPDGGRRTAVPLGDVRGGETVVRLPYPREQVEAAPQITAGRLIGVEERELRDHYRLEQRSEPGTRAAVPDRDRPAWSVPRSRSSLRELGRQAVGAFPDFHEGLGRWLEAAVYISGGALLLAGAVLVLVDTVPALWAPASAAARALSVLEHTLLLFVMVEVFHTVRFAIARHELAAEPFLVVVVIATVRRILVLTAGSEPITTRDTLIELGLLIVLLLASTGALLAVHRARLDRRDER